MTVTPAQTDARRPLQRLLYIGARLSGARARLSGARARLWAPIAPLLAADDQRAEGRRRALLAFAIRVLSAGIAYFVQVALARWMGSYQYGVFVFVWAWVLILGGLAPLGLNIAAMRFIPEYGEKGQTAHLRGFLFASRAMTFAAATLMALFAGGALWLAPGLVERPYLLPAFLGLACLPSYALSDINDCIGRAYGRMVLALVPPFIVRPLLLLSAMLAARAIGLPPTASTAVSAAIVATWATAAIQMIALARHTGRELARGDKSDKSYAVRHWLGTALPIVLIAGFELLLQNTDLLVIARYLPPDQVGVYFAVLKTIGLVAFVHFAVGSALAHRFSALNARGDDRALRGLVSDAAQWTFWPSLAGAGLLLLLGKPLLWLFGADFGAAYGVMFVLAAGFVLRASMGPAEYVLNMLGAQKACAAVFFATAALNLVLNFALVPVWGLYGAASATAFSLSFSAFAFQSVARRRLGLDLAVWARPPVPIRR